MANPLTLFVVLKTDTFSQGAAVLAAGNFPPKGATAASFYDTVHYARVALVPNQDGSAGNYGVLVITEFDGTMDTYLSAFWNQQSPENGATIKDVFVGLMSIALHPPKGYTGKDSVDYKMFYDFIYENNLNKDPEKNFSAYDWTVPQILTNMPS